MTKHEVCQALRCLAWKRRPNAPWAKWWPRGLSWTDLEVLIEMNDIGWC